MSQLTASEINDALDVAECAIHDQVKDPTEREWLHGILRKLRAERLSAVSESARTIAQGLRDKGYADIPNDKQAFEHRTTVTPSADTTIIGTPRTDAAIAEATDHKADDFKHYMTMTGVLNQLCRELEMDLNAARATRSATEELKPGVVKDAVRYRWLRHDTKDVAIEQRKGQIVEVYQGQAMDEQIDKAMNNTPDSGAHQ